MTKAQRHRTSCASFTFRIAVIATALSLGACAQGIGIGDNPGLGLASGDGRGTEAGRSDLAHAITYWGEQYAKNPRDKTTALNYAKNLNAAGEDKQALAVLQQIALVHGRDPEVTALYGRLALKAGQTQLAHKLLAHADDPQQPDWRVVSGRGAALAKAGKYEEAVDQFERALQLAPSNPTVMNNLAMAKAATGDLVQAEALLRQAIVMPTAKPKVAKNLALVLNLQGRTAEAARYDQDLAQSQAAIRPSAHPATAPAEAANQVAQAIGR